MTGLKAIAYIGGVTFEYPMNPLGRRELREELETGNLNVDTFWTDPTDMDNYLSEVLGKGNTK